MLIDADQYRISVTTQDNLFDMAIMTMTPPVGNVTEDLLIKCTDF